LLALSEIRGRGGGQKKARLTNLFLETYNLEDNNEKKVEHIRREHLIYRELE
jgi:hypothetical protein